MVALRIFASACWSRGRPLGKFIYVIDFFTNAVETFRYTVNRICKIAFFVTNPW
jgi:hypothetical protein